MGFYKIMQNLVVGIAGSIFSSVIVSVVFYVLNEYQNELNKAKDMVYSLYGVVAMNLTEEQKNMENVVNIGKDKEVEKIFEQSNL